MDLSVDRGIGCDDMCCFDTSDFLPCDDFRAADNEGEDGDEELLINDNAPNIQNAIRLHRYTI